MERLRLKINRYFGEYEIGVFDDSALFIAEGAQRRTAFLQARNACGAHIFLRPAEHREPFYMMADDLSRSSVQRFHVSDSVWRPGRMCVETSPGNFQVWIRSERSLSDSEKRYWLSRMGSDPGAAPRRRWGRFPGFRNRKEKYCVNGVYPLARLIWIDYRNSASVPFPFPTSDSVFESCAPGSSFNCDPFLSVGGSCVSSGGRRVSSIFRSDYETGDASRTDFRFCLALLRRGYSEDCIKDRLLSERQDWKNHSGQKRTEHYLNRTIREARKVIDG